MGRHNTSVTIRYISVPKVSGTNSYTLRKTDAEMENKWICHCYVCFTILSAILSTGLAVTLVSAVNVLIPSTQPLGMRAFVIDCTLTTSDFRVTV